MILAYDAQALWDATAQLFFATAETAYPYLNQPVDPNFEGFDLTLIADAVAVIHLLNLPVAEPERMASALRAFPSDRGGETEAILQGRSPTGG